MFVGQLVIEMKLFLRDRQAVFWTFFFPVMLVLLFGFVFNRRESNGIRVAVIDTADSALADTVYLKLSQYSFLRVHGDSLVSALENLRNGEIQLAVTLSQKPYDKKFSFLIYYNHERPDLRYMLQGLLMQIRNYETVRSQSAITPSVYAEPVQPDRRSVRYIDFLLPGVICMTVVSTGLFAIGMVVVAYREKGKLRRLSVTPLPKPVFIAGQMVNRYFIVLMQSFVLMALGMFMFDVHLAGNLLDFIAALTVGMLAFIAIGFLVASVASTTETASGITNTIFLPMIFLSGVYFDLGKVPGLLRPLIEFLPLTHLVRAIRAIFNQGLTFGDVLPQMAVLAVWIVVCFTASVKLFKWE
jgi:ABC-2 type transport system permease protein